MSDLPAHLVHLRQYSAVGQFVSAFEWCCWRLRFYSAAILQTKGLRDFGLAEIIFNQRIFTAEPLVSCFISLTSHATAKDPEVQKKTDALKSRFSELVKKRNELLHGTYMLGVDQDGAPTDFLVEKQTPDKYGTRTLAVVSSENEMTNLIRECREADEAIREVFTMVHMKIRSGIQDHS